MPLTSQLLYHPSCNLLVALPCFLFKLTPVCPGAFAERNHPHSIPVSDNARLAPTVVGPQVDKRICSVAINTGHSADPPLVCVRTGVLAT
ncbi:hypothetical protein BJV74DRAFT_555279 [Russula compacta]|nr:hypothetical protein BJV74DRAFT_555279 [Russula compacta]